MRIAAVAAPLSFLVSPLAVAAHEAKPQAETSTPDASSSKIPTNEERAAQAEAERKKADALAQARQRRMNRLTRSICNGC
jgi:hypothetical protein